MDERKLLKHAKNYLDQLAEGIDPLSGRAVPEDSTLNQENLSKCFQYVSQVLQREIDRLQPPRKTDPPVDLRTLIFQIHREMGLSGACGFLNRAAREWLIQEGYAAEIIRPNRLPDYATTPKGDAIGLSLEEARNKKTGLPYRRLLCGRQAQQLLRDNTNQLLALERKQWDPLLACLTPEWHKNAVCLQEPVLLKDVTDNINRQLPPELPRKIVPVPVFYWLGGKGLMEKMNFSSSTWLPTVEGERLGIIPGSGKRGSRWSVPAQQFLLDNLNEIVQDLASGEAYRAAVREKFTVPEGFSDKMTYGNDLNWMPGLENAINEALAALDGGTVWLPKNLIWKWLYKENFYRSQGEGRNRRCIPTKEGESIGLFVGPNGYIVFPESAQRFIVDNLQNIFDYYNSIQ